MKTATSGSHPHGALHGKSGFGAAEKKIYRRRKLQSLTIFGAVKLSLRV
jgi:hypothetical protein